MSCFRCKRTGEIICDPVQADLACEICGSCAAEEAKRRAAQQEPATC